MSSNEPLEKWKYKKFYENIKSKDLLQTMLQYFLHIGICVKILEGHLSMTSLKKIFVKFLTFLFLKKKFLGLVWILQN